jgi:hypothetical protein
MIETEDRQGRAGFGDKSGRHASHGMQGKNCRQGGPGRQQRKVDMARQAGMQTSGEVSEGKKGGREHKTNRQGRQSTAGLHTARDSRRAAERVVNQTKQPCRQVRKARRQGK